MCELLDSINKIKSNFFATTYDGTMIHFLSYAEFPEKVFIDKDEAICKVKCKHIDSDNSINLVLSFENNDKTEFYFSPPKILAITKETGFEFGVNNSMERFKRMTFTHIIDGKQRNLVLMIDNDSFQSSLEEYNNFQR